MLFTLRTDVLTTVKCGIYIPIIPMVILLTTIASVQTNVAVIPARAIATIGSIQYPRVGLMMLYQCIQIFFTFILRMVL